MLYYIILNSIRMHSIAIILKKYLLLIIKMGKNLDLLLVNVGGTKKRVYQDLSKDFSAIEPPFWAALTAGFIRNKGYDVKILDSNAENLNFKETIDRIEEYNPKLTNIIAYGQQPAASTQLMGNIGELCKKIKNKNPIRKIILTGLHPSALPQKTIEEEVCDFVGVGEGFYTIENLLKERKLDNIQGLVYRDNEIIKINPRAKNVENLTSELSDVAWDLLPMDKYKAHNHQCLQDLESRSKYASLSTSLGCPFKCDFCSIHATFGERKIRYWNPEWVLDQISHLVEKYDVKNFKIIDEMFIFNPKHYMPIVEGLIERDYGLNIWAYGRIDTVKKEHLEKIKQAGFNWLCYGFEAGSDKVRDDVSKGKFNEEDMRRVAKMTKNAGINILGNYMFGLPEDDLESMQKTLDLAIDLNCEFANFYGVMPYPGSKLYNVALNKGFKLPESWLGYSQHSYECQPLPTNKISAEEVLKFRDEAFNKYFTNPKYLTMIGKKFGRNALNHIKEMTKIKLKRKLLGD